MGIAAQFRDAKKLATINIAAWPINDDRDEDRAGPEYLADQSSHILPQL